MMMHVPKATTKCKSGTYWIYNYCKQKDIKMSFCNKENFYVF